MIRVLLVVLCLGMLGLVLLGIRRGWHNRLTRQAHLAPLPSVPADPGEAVLSARGRYVGTTFALRWQERVVHGGLGARADAVASLHPAGLLLDRQGNAPIFVPAAAWIEAWLAPGLAGTKVDEGDLLVLRWRLEDTELDTGFRADDETTYPEWVRMINGKVAA